MQRYLLQHLDNPEVHRIDGYMKTSGYTGLEKALSMKAEDIIDEVKRSGLRGRGGAGFPTAMKWTFARSDKKTPRYLICNADEGEPGTFKDKVILERNPHLLIEGMVISAYAIGAEYGFIYLRGEYPQAYRILEDAIKEAKEKNFLGDNILGKGVRFHLSLFRGAGAYICGEETALIESLEGKRGQPRIKPPFPVNEGYDGKPTVINNVETLVNIPLIIRIGAEAYAKIGRPECPGPKLYSVSGHIVRPGVYELPMGTTLREIIYDHAGGLRDQRRLKAVIPGGISTPVLPPDKIDCPMDFVNMPRYGSMLGSGAVIVLDETADLVKVCLRALEFFQHESCGKCTPCREGVGWMKNILRRLSEGNAVKEDLNTLEEVSNSISGRCFCPLGDTAACVAQNFLKHFRQEFEERLR